MKNKYILLMMAVALMVTSSCKKLLETEPKNSISAEVAMKEAAGVEGLTNSLYQTLQGSGYYGRDFIVVPEVLSDNMRIASTNSNRFVQESNNAVAATINLWQTGYSLINRANGVIKYADIANGLTPLRRKQLAGEAYFIRALAYFDLVRTYSYNPKNRVTGRPNSDLGVPIVLNYVENFPGDITYPSRASIDETFTQIKSDLDKAITLLDNLFAPKRISLSAANALRARVALYNGDWADAATFANTAINGGVGTFVDPSTATTPALKSAAYASIFNTPSSAESIFELNYEITESLGSDGLSSIYTRSNPISTAGAGYGDATPQANLVAAYEAGDVRKDLLFAITKGSEAIFWNQKYPAAKAPQIDNIKIIRMSEMYLTRAEANFRNGSAIGATPQADLDKIRLRANLAVTPVTLNAILKERRVELAYEGHRWFDLLRLGSDIGKSNSTLPANATPNSTLLFTDFKVLSRIPLTEVQNNPKIIQNYLY
ncbi:RagB/SusD family nutrient uptake outer membrane protein [Pedobacter boryungensis]|uniref:RagB/SusD family nutrient uptake outer membrane protein n=1 Tax=Pedobacter boryungensis TaxID=869962 RepID=A0ABX2DBF6_9SPHI|nr:RagB/SusD family nutrient uptake outer membrane protein [Pedobacter boryungensis]NQX30909.1 RagB/SusD family nutrient uptake outer membrane protein [Pedobacter boryungensis]